MKGQIREIFSSIQGEGIYVGVRQIFLRLAGCNLKCTYCDTVEKPHGQQDMFRIETSPGSQKFFMHINPIDPGELLTILKDFGPSIHHSLSITGGEPLVHQEFLNEFLPIFKGLCPVFLETNGTLAEPLAKLLPFIDIISMDMKLPSATGIHLWQQHEEFLRLAQKKDVYIKVVLTRDTTYEEIDQVVHIIKKTDKSIPLVLQPVTPINRVKGISPGKVIAFQDYCNSFLNQVRVIPQMHKLLKQL